jgi:hypothetical protein
VALCVAELFVGGSRQGGTDLSNRRQIIPAAGITRARLSETAGRRRAWSSD